MNEEFYVRCQWGNHSFIPSSIIFMGKIGFCTSVVSTRGVELNILDKKCLPLEACMEREAINRICKQHICFRSCNCYGEE